MDNLTPAQAWEGYVGSQSHDDFMQLSYDAGFVTVDEAVAAYIAEMPQMFALAPEGLPENLADLLAEDIRENVRKIVADLENGDESWWEAATEAIRSGNTPEGANRFQTQEFANWLQSTNVDRPLFVLAHVAEAIETWAATFPGWDDGPEHARHPLLIDQL